MKKRVRFYGVVAALLVAGSLVVVGRPTTKQTELFSVTVSALALVKAGEPIIARVEIKNMSNRVLSINTLPAGKSYILQITKSDGGNSYIIQITRSDGIIPIKTSASLEGGNVVPLEPDESWQNDFPLTKLYDMASPGTYAVQIGRKHADDPGAPAYIMSTLDKITVTR